MRIRMFMLSFMNKEVEEKERGRDIPFGVSGIILRGEKQLAFCFH